MLLSYLLSALGDAEIDVVLTKAQAALAPGGLLIVDDFMLNDVGPGPAFAALWFLQDLAFRSDGASFSTHDLAGRLRKPGFTPAVSDVLIPETIKTIVSRKAST